MKTPIAVLIAGVSRWPPSQMRTVGLSMKRDMELIRSLLFAVEAADQPLDLRKFASGEDLPGAAYHCKILHEAGYLSGVPVGGGQVWANLQLTWDGHEFLDTLRDPTVWDRTKAGAAAVGGVGVDLLLSIGKAYLKSEAEKRLGLNL